MKKILSSTVASAIALLAFNATAANPTNLLQTVSIALKVYSQGPSTTNKAGEVTSTVDVSSFGTKDLIAALVTNASSKASLDIVSPITVIGTNFTFTTNKTKVTTNAFVVLTNASTFLAVVDGATVTTISNSVLNVESFDTTLESSVVKSNGTLVSFTKLNIGEIILSTSTLSFTARGLSVSTLDSIKAGKTSFGVKNGTLSLAGHGTKGTNAVLVDGTLTIASGGTYVQ